MLFNYLIRRIVRKSRWFLINRKLHHYHVMCKKYTIEALKYQQKALMLLTTIDWEPSQIPVAEHLMEACNEMNVTPLELLRAGIKITSEQ